MNADCRTRRKARQNAGLCPAVTGAEGSILLTIVVAMVLIGALGAAVVALNSTGMFNLVTYNSNQNAYYIAESGLRYAATLYKNTDNAPGGDGDDKNADDDKRDVLENMLDGCTYAMPDGKGQFSLDVKSYWMYATNGSSSNSTATFYFSGGLPDDFDLPSSGIFVRFDKNNESCAPLDYSNAVLDAATSSLQCTVMSNIDEGDMLYLALPVTTEQTIRPGGDITLVLKESLETGSTCVPPRNGYFRILQGNTINDLESILLFYEEASLEGTTLTLKHIFDREHTQFSEIAIGTGSDSKVIFKKNLVLESTGQIGSQSFGASRTLRFAVPVSDSFKGELPEVITFKSERDLRDNFDADSDVGMEVDSYITAGGRSLFATMTSIPIENGDKFGTFRLRKADRIQQAWEENGHLLDYDVQVKLSNGRDLTHGGEGLSVRLRPSRGDYDCLGISMMKYDTFATPPYIIFRPQGSYEPQVGDTLEYGSYYWFFGWNWSRRGTGEIVAIENAQGGRKKVFIDNMTGNFVRESDDLRFNGSDVGSVFKVGSGVSDMIPNGIKPFVAGKDLSNTLLLVLWQQMVQADGSIDYRWLAYKELPASYDPYIQGNQDTSYDGQIVHDNTTLLVRVREVYRDTTKVNNINVFYADMYDTSVRGIPPHDPPNSIPYDIVPRKRYKYGEPTKDGSWNPQWPPKKIDQWSSYTDFFSHVQVGDKYESVPRKFQWDGLNNATELQEFDYFELSDDGTITISELVTPDSGTYRVPEIGMHAFGDVYKGGTGDFRVASFNDFALLLFTPGYDRGGFLAATQF
jgi:hypothetical protein